MNDNFFNQVFGAVRDASASSADTSGQVADWLINAGLSIAAISQILNGVATSAAASPSQVAYVQNEMRYLQNYQEARTNWLPLLGIGAVLLYFATRRN